MQPIPSISSSNYPSGNASSSASAASSPFPLGFAMNVLGDLSSEEREILSKVTQLPSERQILLAVNILLTNRAANNCANEPNQTAELFFRLATSRPAGSTFQLGSETLTGQQLLVKCLTHDPKFGPAYNCLALTLRNEETIQLGSEIFTKQQLFLKCLTYDPKYVPALFNLAIRLPQEGTIQIGSETFTAQQLFIKCLNCDPKFALGYLRLAFNLREGETIQLSSESLTRGQILHNAIVCDPLVWLPYYKHALTLPEGGRVYLGRTILSKEAALRMGQLIGYSSVAQDLSQRANATTMAASSSATPSSSAMKRELEDKVEPSVKRQGLGRDDEEETEIDLGQ